MVAGDALAAGGGDGGIRVGASDGVGGGASSLGVGSGGGGIVLDAAVGLGAGGESEGSSFGVCEAVGGE